MYKEISKLVMYREFGEDSILNRLSDIIFDFENSNVDKDHLISRIYAEIRKLLEMGTNYGFNRNLWQDYLVFLLVTNENPFTLTAEKVGASDGSVNSFAMSDLKIFCKLFQYDFKSIEEALGINCFSVVTNYQSIPKKVQMYNRSVSEKVRFLSDKIDSILCGVDMNETGNDAAGNDAAGNDASGSESAGNGAAGNEAKKTADDAVKAVFELVTTFYKNYGIGMFGLNKAFRIIHNDGEEMQFVPINNTDQVCLDDLIGYEIQKKKLTENTEAFLRGFRANNCLLYGDAGTGKSTSIKALINAYYEDGLRMIEIYKHQFRDLSAIISKIKNRNYKFIIYMDDLSFEEFEIEYKYLKAVIEGGLETRPDNVLIYATSNRRNLIKETWNDHHDMDLEKHHSDTVQEKLSLVERFGVSIPYLRPGKKDFDAIVRGLAKKHPEIALSEDELILEANKWALSHSGMSGRAAQQLIEYLLGKFGNV